MHGEKRTACFIYIYGVALNPFIFPSHLCPSYLAILHQLCIIMATSLSFACSLSKAGLSQGESSCSTDPIGLAIMKGSDFKSRGTLSYDEMAASAPSPCCLSRFLSLELSAFRSLISTSLSYTRNGRASFLLRAKQSALLRLRYQHNKTNKTTVSITITDNTVATTGTYIATIFDRGVGHAAGTFYATRPSFVPREYAIASQKQELLDGFFIPSRLEN